MSDFQYHLVSPSRHPETKVTVRGAPVIDSAGNNPLALFALMTLAGEGSLAIALKHSRHRRRCSNLFSNGRLAGGCRRERNLDDAAQLLPVDAATRRSFGAR